MTTLYNSNRKTATHKIEVTIPYPWSDTRGEEEVLIVSRSIYACTLGVVENIKRMLFGKHTYIAKVTGERQSTQQAGRQDSCDPNITDTHLDTRGVKKGASYIHTSRSDDGDRALLRAHLGGKRRGVRTGTGSRRDHRGSTQQARREAAHEGAAIKRR